MGIAIGSGRGARRAGSRSSPDIEIFEGHHDDGPFNRSEAINTAATLAGDWDLGIVIDSDVFLRTRQVQAAIDRAKKTGRVTWAHRRWRGMHEDHTERIVKYDIDFGPEFVGHDMDLLVERTNPVSWSCCIVIPRAVWDAMGGFDQRFAGWGWEDMAWQSVVCGLYGHERIEGARLPLLAPSVRGTDRRRADARHRLTGIHHERPPRP